LSPLRLPFRHSGAGADRKEAAGPCQTERFGELDETHLFG